MHFCDNDTIIIKLERKDIKINKSSFDIQTKKKKQKTTISNSNIAF